MSGRHRGDYFEKHSMVKVALNTSYKNKPPEDVTRDFWHTFNGAFHNYSLPVNQLRRAIREGYSFTSWHSRYRKKDNFILGQHVGLDFDTGITVGELLSDEFTVSNASFIYTTPSHTREKPRLRLVFLMEQPITVPSLYAAVTEQMVRQYKLSDQKCKDPCRVFFGSENCEVIDIGKVMSTPVAAELILRREQEAQKERQLAKEYMANRVIVDPSKANGQFGKMLDSLVADVLSAPDGEKHYTLTKVCYTLGGYVAGGYIEREQAIMKMQEAILSRPSVANKPLAKRTVIESINSGTKRPLALSVDPLERILDEIF